MRALRPNGIYVTVGGFINRLLQALILGPWISMISKKGIAIVTLKPNKDLPYMNELFEAGKVKPVTNGHYTPEEVPSAFRRFLEGAHKGETALNSTHAIPNTPDLPPSLLPEHVVRTKYRTLSVQLFY